MRRAAAIILALALTGGCGGGSAEGDAAPATTESSGRAGMLDETFKARYAVTLTGALMVTHDSTLDLRLTKLGATAEDAAPSNLDILSVGPVDVVQTGLDDGSAFRAVFDITHYGGDGDYEIPAGSPRSAAEGAAVGTAAPSPNLSNAVVQVWPDGDREKPPASIFDDRLDPCRLTIRDNGRSGTLVCPRLRSEAGEATVSLTMEWEELGESADA